MSNHSSHSLHSRQLSESARKSATTAKRPQRSLSWRAATSTTGGPWKRRDTPRPDVTLGDLVVELRKLSGPARKKAEDDFIKKSKGFVHTCCRWFYGDDLDTHDVRATATMALWEAVLSWDAGKGSPFDTWARRGIRFALAKMLRGSRLVRGRRPEDFCDFDEVVRG